jgi:hypothetical protein
MAETATLSLKPDLAEATQRWLAFWDQDLIDRPVCRVTAPKEGATPAGGPRYLAGAVDDFQGVIDQVLAWAETVYWAGDSVPSYTPSFGPDQMAAFCGAELVVPPADSDYGTDWVVPCIEDWEAALPLRVDDDNYWWQRMLAFYRAMAAAFDGRLVLSHLDLHSNMDTLLAMRGGERLCMDMLDVPDTIDRAMADVRAAYGPIYDAVHDAGNMACTGTVGWVPAYHPVRTNTIQCDFAALIGPRQFRRWVAPALEQEAAHLGHCVYHLDGPECLVHLDDLCAIPHLDCIQWTTGARNKPFPEWLDLLKHIQSRGTAVWIPCHVSEIPYYHAALDPRLLWYDAHAGSEREADEALAWLVANT